MSQYNAPVQVVGYWLHSLLAFLSGYTFSSDLYSSLLASPSAALGKKEQPENILYIYLQIL